jgi:hypothetical protein
MVNAAPILGSAIRAACTHATVALTDNSIVSDLDTAEGNREPVVQRLAQNVPITIPQLPRLWMPLRLRLRLRITIKSLARCGALRNTDWQIQAYTDEYTGKYTQI